MTAGSGARGMGRQKDKGWPVYPGGHVHKTANKNDKSETIPRKL